ncbi:hypothetical protein SmJEL517_g04007 [Synchytrium microbalum]|uniref:Coiled-coil domain-containing protein 13 n=1 Tax=Synchytrium microbalum TaxID=1806994 RepID=A0A507BVY3_9FUNG|nr:uncharacterized protein SmJEL517_g04007 [Synchytrium microbalum]TPX33017.1 hypothetical protein SmJEL517_g04007 [Synchytrium microbalum]
MSNDSLLQYEESVYGRDSPPLHASSGSQLYATSNVPFLDLKETKILELSKRNRRLTVALAKERSTSEALSNKIKASLNEEKINCGTIKSKESISSNTSANTISLLEEVKALRSKLATSNRRLEEERLGNQALRVELRNIQKVLKDEIGDDTPLTKALDVNSGWKGRAQQITMLKDRVRDLTAQLSNPAGPSAMLDQKHRDGIKKMETERKISIEAALTEAEQSKAEKDEYRVRCDSLQSRNNLLSKEIKDLKSKIEMVLDKSSKDDKLICSITNELMKHKTLNRDNTSAHPLSKVCNGQEIEIADLKNKLNAQSKELTELRRSKSSPQMNEKGAEVTLVAMEGKIRALKVELDGMGRMRETLEHRLEEAQKEAIHTKMELKQAKRKNASLEQQQTTQPLHRKPQRPTRSPPGAEQVQELREKLQFVEDHNEALSMMLRDTQRNKEEELRLYDDLVVELKAEIRDTVDKLCRTADPNHKRENKPRK